MDVEVNISRRYGIPVADARRLWKMAVAEAGKNGDCYIDLYFDPLIKRHLAEIDHEQN